MKFFLNEGILIENVQLAIKHFVNSGKIDKEEFEEFLYYIDIKQKAYIYFQLFFLLKEHDKDRLDQNAISLFKELNAYYKNNNRLLRLNSLEQDSLKGDEFDQILYGPIGLINALRKRREVLTNYLRLPSKYRRNVNKLINHDYSFYPLTSQIDVLREIMAAIGLYEDYPESDIKDKILNTAFSSKFDSLDEIRGFLLDSYEQDLHFIPQKNIDEILKFIKDEGLEDDLDILYKNKKEQQIILQVFSHDTLRELTCNTKWCFSRSNSHKDWHEYAQGKWVILLYDFSSYFPDSIVVILPNFDAYDGNNSQMGEADEEYGKNILSSFLSKKQIENL